MRTEAKSKQHGGIALSFVTLLAVGCVQKETIPPQLEMHTNNNADAARFIEIINKQPSQLAIFNERMKGKHPFFEKTKLYTNADYGLSFFIPYGDGGTNIVTGAVYYPVEHETNANNTIVLKDKLHTPHFIDAEKINSSIPITKRFLYSHDFVLLEKQGYTCDKQLMQYEFLKDTEIKIPNDEKHSTRTFSPLSGSPHVELCLYVNSDYIGGEKNYIYGLSTGTLRRWIDHSLKFTLFWTEECFVTQTGFKIEIDVSEYSLTSRHLTPESFVWTFTRELIQEALKHNFSLSLQYRYTYYRRDPNKGISPGEEKEGNVRPNQDDTNTGAVAEPEEEPKEEKYEQIEDDCDGVEPTSMPCKADMTRMVDDLFGAKPLQGTKYKFISFEDFTSLVSQDLRYEYSIAVDDWFGERVISPIHTNKMPYNVNSLTGEETIFSVHSHINRKPPSPQDLLQICTIAEDTLGRPKYKGTLVYIPQDSTFYGLIIKDRAKAAKVAKLLKGEISPTNDFTDYGKCDKLIKKNKRSYIHLNPTETKITKLALILNLMDTGISLVEHSRKQGKTTTLYDVSPVKSKKDRIIYKPIKCQ